MSKLTLVTVAKNVEPEQFGSEQCATVVKAAIKLGRKNVPLPKLIQKSKQLGLSTVAPSGVEGSVKYHVNRLRLAHCASVKRVVDQDHGRHHAA